MLQSKSYWICNYFKVNVDILFKCDFKDISPIATSWERVSVHGQIWKVLHKSWNSEEKKEKKEKKEISLSNTKLHINTDRSRLSPPHLLNQEATQRTSICIFRWVLKFERRVRNMESESSKTSGTDETPFFDSATQRYCLIALINISFVLKTGPAFCRMDRSNCNERIFDRSSWDLE